MSQFTGRPDSYTASLTPKAKSPTTGTPKWGSVWPCGRSTARCTGTRLDLGLGRVSWPPAVNLVQLSDLSQVWRRVHPPPARHLGNRGTDHVNSSTVWPGDNGDWSDYEVLAPPDALWLRGNRLSGWSLHDLLANPPTKNANPHNYNATDYVSAPEFQVYNYYNLNMTGSRVETSGAGDCLFDIYATVDSDKVRILAGARVCSGHWTIRVNQMNALGFPSEGSVSIQTWAFPGMSVWQEIDAPSDRGVASPRYSDNALICPVDQSDNSTAWAFELSR